MNIGYVSRTCRFDGANGAYPEGIIAMRTSTLRPWTDLVKLHPDVESGSLAEAVFAIDFGAIAVADPATPAVYRDPDAFFARVMELLTAVGTPKVHGKVHPKKIVERLKLGESLGEGEPPRLGIATGEVRDAFFGFLEPPRLSSAEVLRKAIVRGVSESMFGYTTGTPSLGPDGKYAVSLSKVSFGRTMSEDEIDLDSGFVMMPAAIPLPETAPVSDDSQPAPLAPDGQPSVTYDTTGPVKPLPARADGDTQGAVEIRFAASRDQVLKSFSAIANLADKSDGGKVRITVQATSAEGYDPAWYRNAVKEPLEAADITSE